MSRLNRQWTIGLSARYAGRTRIPGTAVGLNQYLWVMVYLDGLVRLTAQIVAKRLIYLISMISTISKERNHELRFNGNHQHDIRRGHHGPLQGERWARTASGRR